MSKMVVLFSTCLLASQSAWAAPTLALVHACLPFVGYGGVQSYTHARMCAPLVFVCLLQDPLCSSLVDENIVSAIGCVCVCVCELYVAHCARKAC